MSWVNRYWWIWSLERTNLKTSIISGLFARLARSRRLSFSPQKEKEQAEVRQGLTCALTLALEGYSQSSGDSERYVGAGKNKKGTLQEIRLNG
ncbi:hypothetical protein SAMN04488023_1469 [Pedobacter rhizosphaerae]|uniref:Uncharacterized protein n=1 Tax=Pedobacter rhizosphaerae TaxID=390241 RepID=A0A1H9VP64_9SPHI|nr:hypothetical protein SAMN04488023_1469 [Pedobacter rhizosphaerae]